MTDDPKPRDLRICRERQDAAIADMREAIHLLRVRVAALEAEHNAMIPTLSEEVGRLRARVAALEARAVLYKETP